MLMPERYARRRARIIGIGREVEGLRKTGEEFPMDLSVGEFVHGAERRFVWIVRDLIERVSAERRLRDIQDQLSQMAHGNAVAEMDEPLVMYTGSGTTNRTLLHADALGSIIAHTNRAGAPTAVLTYDEYDAPAPPTPGAINTPARPSSQTLASITTKTAPITPT